MKPYIVIVHKDAGSYGMTFPDAPGCFSAADAADDLFAMARREALELWAEGMRDEGVAVPEPRDFEALRADPEWRESFRDAAFVIAVPPPWELRSEAAE